MAISHSWVTQTLDERNERLEVLDESLHFCCNLRYTCDINNNILKIVDYIKRTLAPGSEYYKQESRGFMPHQPGFVMEHLLGDSLKELNENLQIDQTQTSDCLEKVPQSSSR